MRGFWTRRLKVGAGFSLTSYLRSLFGPDANYWDSSKAGYVSKSFSSTRGYFAFSYWDPPAQDFALQPLQEWKLCRGGYTFFVFLAWHQSHGFRLFPSWLNCRYGTSVKKGFKKCLMGVFTSQISKSGVGEGPPRSIMFLPKSAFTWVCGLWL